MFQILLLVFLTIPLIEIYLLLQIGGLIGIPLTIVVVVLTAVIGAWLLRVQGFATWTKVQKSLEKGEVPAIEMIEGLILLVGGALLLTPGFFTDIIGFLCLIPASRRALALHLLKSRLAPMAGDVPGSAQSSTSNTMEGEFHRDD